MKVTYKKKEIEFALKMLDQISVTGLHNAERVVAVAGILAKGEEEKEEKEGKDGNNE